MRPLSVLVRRELGAYFATPLAFVYLLVFVVLAAALTFYVGAGMKTSRLICRCF